MNSREQQEPLPGKKQDMDPIPQFTSDEYKPSNKFLGKVVLVSAGDSGVGRDICICFAKEGATVAFTYLEGHDDQDAEETLEMIRRDKFPDAKDPFALPADLGYDENCKKVVDKVLSVCGKIDVLVNNAAEQFMTGSVEDIDEERLARVFRTNIFSYFFLSKHAIKHMIKGSSIINSTSVVAYKGHANLLDYTATRSAIVAFTKGLALELANKGIRVNAVAAGPIWSPLIPESFSAEDSANFGKDVPMKRAGLPIEVGPSYVFLASNDCSSYITGQVIHPNGGTIVNG